MAVLKRRAKTVLRPWLRSLLAWVDHRVDHRVALAGQPVRNAIDHSLHEQTDAVRRVERRCDELERRLTEVDVHLERFRSTVPTLLDAVSTQHSAARELKRQEHALWESMASAENRVEQVEGRVESVRREVLFEMRYGAHDRGAVESTIEPKVLDQAKLDGMGGEVRLNLGCGAFAVEGFLNVDVREIEGVVDVVADLGHLPFDPISVAEIVSFHVLEHFPEEELARRLLPYWVGLLQPGGLFRAVVPDAETMMREWVEGNTSFEDLRVVTFGDQEYDGDFHFTMFSVGSLTALLEHAGLEDVAFVATGRRNGLCHEMEVRAVRRPAGSR